MENTGITEIKDRIEIELKATNYGLQCIEIAFGVEKNTDATLVTRTNIASSFDPTFIKFPFDSNLYAGKMDNHAVARGTANRIVAMLVGTVYEVLTQEDCKYWNKYGLYENDEMKFLKWVRHGVFHSNRFILDKYGGGAEWHDVEITQDMEGEVVFTEVDWENRKFIPDPNLPNGHGYSEEDINEGLLEAGDGLALVQTVLEVLDEC